MCYLKKKGWNPHPIPGSEQIFQDWSGNMQNYDIFAKKYRNQIENNACTRHLWKSRSSYLEVHPQIWYWRFSLLKNDQHEILSESSWMSTSSTACSNFTKNVKYFIPSSFPHCWFYFVRIHLNVNQFNLMFKVHNECWIFLLSNLQSNIPMSSSTCSIQGLLYKLCTCEFYCSWNG